MTKSSDELCFLPLTELLSRFAARRLSPVELMDATLERIETINPLVNAFAFTFFEEARAAARHAEDAWFHGRARALEGLPIAVKDESFIAGQITTNGSLLLKDNVATHTSPANQRLIDKGAIIHARTTTPEFSLEIVTRSPIWGATRNPWNLERTTYGSSGGSGASVAAGMAVAATGSDIGGSLRLPAAICGLVGPKLSYGRVPSDTPYNLITAVSEGALTRNVADSAVLHSELIGPHPADIATIREQLVLPNVYAPHMHPKRVAYSHTLGLGPLAPAIAHAFDELLDQIRSSGCEVVDAAITLDANCARHFRAMLDMELGGSLDLDELARDKEHLIGPGVRSRLAGARNASAADYMASRVYCAELYPQFSALLEEADFLLVPTVRRVDIRYDQDIYLDPDVLAQIEAPYEKNLCLNLTYPINLINRLPAINVPVAQEDGVWIGVQVITRSYADAAAFEGALFIEQLAGRLYDSPDRRPKL